MRVKYCDVKAVSHSCNVLTKLANLEAALIQNYDPVHYAAIHLVEILLQWVTGVKCRATSIAKKSKSH